MKEKAFFIIFKGLSVAKLYQAVECVFNNEFKESDQAINDLN